jgi:hypothetical protein
MLELADETFHLALRYLDTFLLRRGASPGFRVADCFFFSFLLFSARRRHRASPLSDASPSLFFFETSFSLGPENFLARNGAGSEPVPALPLGALPCDRALYLDGQHQPLCNKLKRLGITCVFVAAKVVEVCAPPAGEFAHAAEVSTFSRSQLLLAERALLRELEYDLYHPTCSSFATAYVAASADDIASNARAPRATRVWIEERESGERGSGPRLGSEPLVTSTNESLLERNYSPRRVVLSGRTKGVRLDDGGGCGVRPGGCRGCARRRRLRAVQARGGGGELDFIPVLFRS